MNYANGLAPELQARLDARYGTVPPMTRRGAVDLEPPITDKFPEPFESAIRPLFNDQRMVKGAIGMRPPAAPIDKCAPNPMDNSDAKRDELLKQAYAILQANRHHTRQTVDLSAPRPEPELKNTQWSRTPPTIFGRVHNDPTENQYGLTYSASEAANQIAGQMYAANDPARKIARTLDDIARANRGQDIGETQRKIGLALLAM